MNVERIYIDTVQLLLDIAPELFRPGCFALKGGTAINLFIRELPRLSVDLDLVWKDHETSRVVALTSITQELSQAGKNLKKRGIQFILAGSKGEETKIFFERDQIRVKVEVNHIFRGTILPTERKPLVQSAQDLFFTELDLPILAKDELYASKLVAALDRQHPRDIFDIHLLLEEEGISQRMMDCFVGYLAGHNRPMHEVIFSSPKNLEVPFKNQFQGLSRIPVSLQTLTTTQKHLLEILPTRFRPEHRKFLLTLADGTPDWSLLPFAHLSEMPAIQWKLKNLKKLKRENPIRFRDQRVVLEKGFQNFNLLN